MLGWGELGGVVFRGVAAQGSGEKKCRVKKTGT